MSRKRVPVGTDARGRPVMAWADPDTVDAPRFGHMEPAYDAGSIERRIATPDELEARSAIRESPSPVRHPWRSPVRSEEEPTMVETAQLEDLASTQQVDSQVDAGPAQPGGSPPPDQPASTDLVEASLAERLTVLQDATRRAVDAWDTKLYFAERANAADAEWAEAQSQLQRAYTAVEVGLWRPAPDMVIEVDAPGLRLSSNGGTVVQGPLTAVEGFETAQKAWGIQARAAQISPAEVRHEQLLEDGPSAAQRQAEEDAAYAERDADAQIDDHSDIVDAEGEENAVIPLREETNDPITVPSEAGGGPELPRQQQRILDATIAFDGDRRAAAEYLGISIENTNVQLHKIGAKGLLPAALIGKLPAGFAKYATVVA